MNIMAEAFNIANIKANDFEDRQIDEKTIQLDMQIEFMEKWLKMLDRNAPEKEKHNFIVKHGFVSVKHFSLYMSCINDVNMLKEKLEDIKFDISNKEIIKLKQEISEKELMAENIKNETYYKFVLRTLGERDITPYGEDILKKNILK